MKVEQPEVHKEGIITTIGRDVSGVIIVAGFVRLSVWPSVPLAP